MITNSMTIRCVVLIVILVLANKCSKVMCFEKSARIKDIFNRNNRKIAMNNTYVTTEKSYYINRQKRIHITERVPVIPETFETTSKFPSSTTADKYIAHRLISLKRNKYHKTTKLKANATKDVTERSNSLPQIVGLSSMLEAKELSNEIPEQNEDISQNFGKNKAVSYIFNHDVSRFEGNNYSSVENNSYVTTKSPIYEKTRFTENVSNRKTPTTTTNEDNELFRHSQISMVVKKLQHPKRKPKGFFGHGGLFALPKVLNFFPVGGERECQPEEYNVARAGICLNPYDCRQRDGVAGGDCAHGLGVCCVFEVTCGGVAANNLTYFMSPGFPELWGGDKECSIVIEKAFAGIMQLRIDFVHFTIGQPNRLTGECDEDALILGEGKSNFTVCGQNHGQHIYYTLPTVSEKREAGELPTIKSTKLSIRMRGGDMPRLWLLRIAQLPLVNSAPNNCLQYFTSNNGTIKTFNFASNGRHLASQEYRACIRRNAGNCAMRYSSCDARSFKIGSFDGEDPDYQAGVLQGGIGPPATSVPSTTSRVSTVSIYQQTPSPGSQNDTMNQDVQDQMMEADDSMQDEVEGSGMDPQVEANSNSASRPSPEKKETGFFQMIWSYISWIWEQDSRRSRSFPVRWSPYIQHYKSGPENNDFRYYGYGTFGLGLHGFGRQACQDRITIPCESEYFVSSTSYGPGVCDPHHCGNSFCHGQPPDQCRVETSITPFAVSVHFGPPREKRSPEENIGACLKFQQVPCEV